MIMKIKSIEKVGNRIYVNDRFFATVVGENKFDFSNSEFSKFDRLNILTSRQWKIFINRNLLPPEKRYISTSELFRPNALRKAIRR